MTYAHSHLAVFCVEDILTLDRVVNLILREQSLRGYERLVLLATALNRGKIDEGTAAAYCGLPARHLDTVFFNLVSRRFLSRSDDGYKNQKILSAFESRVELHYNHGPHSLRPPFTVGDRVRNQVYERDGYECWYCGATENLSLDHMTPQSRGGTDCIENLLTCCHSCNSAKGSKTFAEYIAFLKDTGEALPPNLCADVNPPLPIHLRAVDARYCHD